MYGKTNTPKKSSRGGVPIFSSLGSLVLIPLGNSFFLYPTMAKAKATCVGKPQIRKPRQPKQPKRERALDEHGEQPDDKKRQIPNMFYKEISDTTGLEMKDVKAVFDALSEHVATKLREDRRFTIPSIVLFRLKDTPGRPAATKKLFDKEVSIAAKPPGKRVHPLVLKPLKVAVNVANE